MRVTVQQSWTHHPPLRYQIQPLHLLNNSVPLTAVARTKIPIRRDSCLSTSSVNFKTHQGGDSEVVFNLSVTPPYFLVAWTYFSSTEYVASSINSTAVGEWWLENTTTYDMINVSLMCAAYFNCGGPSSKPLTSFI